MSTASLPDVPATATTPARRGRRRLLRGLLWARLGLVVLAVVGGGALWLVAREAMGGAVTGERLARVHRSRQWRDGEFVNPLPRVAGPRGRAIRELFVGGSDYRSPDAPLPVVRRTGADYVTPPASGLRVTWLGHSTLLLEIDGRRVPIDPVWGERASPFPFLGPKRFFAPPLPLAELPTIDAAVISHDHYDWGLFDLALHGWTEPMERVLVAADSQRVRVAAPRPGDMVEPAALGPVTRWWPTVPWESVAEAPAWSSSVEQLLRR